MSARSLFTFLVVFIAISSVDASAATRAKHPIYQRAGSYGANRRAKLRRTQHSAHRPRHGGTSRSEISVAKTRGEHLRRENPELFSRPPLHEEGGRIVYFEYGIAEATAGISPDGRRTLIEKFNLVATGPRTIEEEVRDYVKECVEAAVTTAAGAAYGTPSPEPSARLAAGFTAFKGSLYSCLSVSKLAQSYFSKFDLDLVQREHWVDGIELKFNAENISAKSYELLYGEIAKRAPAGAPRDIANAFYRLSAAEADLTRINIDAKLGDPIREANKWVPITPDAQVKALEKGLQEARLEGVKLVSAVIPATEEGERVAQQYASSVVGATQDAITHPGDALDHAVDRCKKNLVGCAISPIPGVPVPVPSISLHF